MEKVDKGRKGNKRGGKGEAFTIDDDEGHGGTHAEADTRSVLLRMDVNGSWLNRAWRPPSWFNWILTRLIFPVLLWAVLYLLVGRGALPGPSGTIFTIYLVLIGGLVFGAIFSVLKMPPLLGMLAFGILLRNIPQIEYGTAIHINPQESSILRQLALIVILTRAGLGLDPVALMKLKGVVIRLAFCPCIIEAVTLAIVSHFILGFPWVWGFVLGFVIAAVSPAVIVPNLLSLREKKYGVAKGIPTIVIAASSVDDILAISAFGLVLGLAFSTSDSLLASIFQGPLELVLGIGFGLLWGTILGVFFAEPETKGNSNVLIIRVLLIFGGGCLSVFGFQKMGYPGSGALGCLTAAFVSAVFWRQKGILTDNNNLTEAFSILWYIFQPILFGLIGCEIDMKNIDPTIAGLGIVCLGIGLTVRVIATFFIVMHAGLNVKERLFVAISWIPKATVQAAIGPVALDTARTLHAGKRAEELGLQVLTLAVLAILITAPIGAIAIVQLGPKLLSNESPNEPKTNNVKDNTTTTSDGSGESETIQDSQGNGHGDFGNGIHPSIVPSTLPTFAC